MTPQENKDLIGMVSSIHANVKNMVSRMDRYEMRQDELYKIKADTSLVDEIKKAFQRLEDNFTERVVAATKPTIDQVKSHNDRIVKLENTEDKQDEAIDKLYHKFIKINGALLGGLTIINVLAFLFGDQIRGVFI